MSATHFEFERFNVIEQDTFRFERGIDKND